MLRIRQIKVPIDLDNLLYLKNKIIKLLKANEFDIKNIEIVKKSIDARDKSNILYIYEVDIDILNEEKYLNNKKLDIIKVYSEEYKVDISGTLELNNRPIIVGSGPSGLFSAYLLSLYGYKPIIIERGKKVEERVNIINKFWDTGKLDINTNVQFGEGGAGTFSDGKLNTLTKDKFNRSKKVFDILIENGAPSEIRYLKNPHIGTDILRKVIINIRNKIISFGGEFRYDTILTDLIINNNKIVGIEVNNKEIINTDILILCIGHSARDTFYMLNKYNLGIEKKPFAVGVRIQHRQDFINKSQYGASYKKLPPASYKLTYQTHDKRGVYSFCMCPGGYVVNASSEEGLLAINGMSNYKRDSLNANSAIVVTVNPSDFPGDVLSGLEFQRKLEKLAYKYGNGKIPVQLYKDFINNKTSTSFGSISPVFKGDYSFSNLNLILPKFITSSITEAMDNFNTKIKGFKDNDSIISAVESRTSSPIRIPRDEAGEAMIKGLYPCGEGSGYAGGITTAAIDGMKVAEFILKKYKSLN